MVPTQYRNIKSSVAGPGCFIPDPGSEFFHPGTRIRVKKIPDPGSASKILISFAQKTQKLVSKLSEISSGMFIPDPDLNFLTNPDL
jgi:hypothetical protein